MASSKRAIRADEQAWKRLGELLQSRRVEMGYNYRPQFARDRRLNIRLITDIENSYRPNTFLMSTMHDIARAYAVTFESVAAVLRGEAGELAPVTSVRPGALDTGPGPPPITDEARAAAARPHADEIWQRLVVLAAGGVTDPTGAEVFGAGTPDAKTWDDPNLRRTFTVAQMVWLLADIRRADEARAAGGNSSGAAGALVTGAVS